MNIIYKIIKKYQLIKYIRQSKTKVLRWLRLFGNNWNEGLHGEVNFWANALADPENHWVKSDYDLRVDPLLPLQEEIKGLFITQPISLKILDVGAGPLTSLGKVWSGTKIKIIAIDPLAREYDKILNQIGLKPLVRTIYGIGEEIDKYFKENEFDITFASNALDHSKNPIMVITKMLYVTRPGGWVYLSHFANEGIEQRYIGLHQWNFNIKRGEFLINNGLKKISINDIVSKKAIIFVSESRASGKRVVICKMKKY